MGSLWYVIATQWFCYAAGAVWIWTPGQNRVGEYHRLKICTCVIKSHEPLISIEKISMNLQIGNNCVVDTFRSTMVKYIRAETRVTS